MILALFIILACFSLFLGILGIFLPGLPTTPFLVLASISILKGSPRLHQRLLDSRIGAYIKRYEENPGLHLKTKLYIISLMVAICCISVFLFIPSGLLKTLVSVAGVIGVAVVVFVIPTIKD